MSIIKTERLILRPWCEEDLAPFAAMNADQRVMKYFPSTINKEDSDAFARRMMQEMQDQGWGRWVVEIPGQAEFIGYVGLVHVPFEAHFTPAVEIGWRIAYDYWDKGYATEAACAVLEYAFQTLKLPEIVSITVPQNTRSRRVMEKIGMHHVEDGDFYHPRLPERHKLSWHVLYMLSHDEWMANKQKHAKVASLMPF